MSTGKVSKNEDGTWCAVVIEPNEDGSRPISTQEQQSVDITIPGINKLFDRNYCLWGKVIWGIALLAALVGCIIQSTAVLKMYFEYAVSVDSKMYRNHTIHFPAITLCPGQSVNFIGNLLDIVNERCKDDPECPFEDPESVQNYPFDKMNLSLEHVWNDFIIPKEAVKTLTPCANIRNEELIEEEQLITCMVTKFTEFKMSSTYQKTFWGTCLVLEPVDPVMKYQGPDTTIKVIINDTMIKSTNNDTDNSSVPSHLRYSDILFFLHKPEIDDRHDAVFFANRIPRNYITEVRFEAKGYNFLNTAEDPCDDELSVTDCKNTCYDQCFENALDCSLPFMVTGKPSCENYNDAVEAHLLADLTYDHAQLCKDQCFCKRPCNTVTYNVNTDVMYKLSKDLTVFFLYYPDNLYHVLTERYVYGIAELFSDLEAHVSFYLGICALTVLQIFEMCFGKCRRQQ